MLITLYLPLSTLIYSFYRNDKCIPKFNRKQEFLDFSKTFWRLYKPNLPSTVSVWYYDIWNCSNEMLKTALMLPGNAMEVTRVKINYIHIFFTFFQCSTIIWQILDMIETSVHISSFIALATDPPPRESLLHFATRLQLIKFTEHLLERPGCLTALHLPNKNGELPYDIAKAKGMNKLADRMLQ